mgnify:CR=1 FL=1
MAKNFQTLWNYVFWTACAVWLIGFCLFSISAIMTKYIPLEKSDAIIVLTGGTDRIQEGLTLLQSDYADLLFISGVNKSVKESDILNNISPETKEKIFSPSLSNYGNMANTNINTVDLGYPGTLPVLNLEVVKQGIKACKVLNLELTTNMHFDRKNYFYPDNPKNFQITQFNTPIGRNGYVEITKKNGETKKIYMMINFNNFFC